MRIIWAMITLPRLSTGNANECSIWPGEDRFTSYDSAGSHFSWTANTSTASVATRNSGTETTATAVMLAKRSNVEPRHKAHRMPSPRASGTAKAAVTAASSSELGRRLATASPTGMPVTTDLPGSPVATPPSQSK